MEWATQSAAARGVDANPAHCAKLISLSPPATKKSKSTRLKQDFNLRCIMPSSKDGQSLSVYLKLDAICDSDTPHRPNRAYQACPDKVRQTCFYDCLEH